MKIIKALKYIYHFCTPIYFIKLRTQFKEYLYWNRVGKKIRGQILNKYKGVPDSKIQDAHLKIVRFLFKNKLKMLPYEFSKKYKPSYINVYQDNVNGLFYVVHEGKKLYFKRNWSKRKIKIYYNNLLIEQDRESPHKYLASDFNVMKNDIVVDCGAAEGIFALNVIEDARKIYLFEPDLDWIEALTETFSNWKNKVEIVSKYLGGNNSGDTVTLDYYLKNERITHFIKIDVEGHEQDVLKGAEKIISKNSKLKIAVSTYHRRNDSVILKNYLESRNFNTTFSDGYVIFIYDKDFEEPLFRRCLLLATKNE